MRVWHCMYVCVCMYVCIYIYIYIYIYIMYVCVCVCACVYACTCVCVCACVCVRGQSVTKGMEGASGWRYVTLRRAEQSVTKGVGGGGKKSRFWRYVINGRPLMVSVKLTLIFRVDGDNFTKLNELRNIGFHTKWTNHCSSISFVDNMKSLLRRSSVSVAWLT